MSRGTHVSRQSHISVAYGTLTRSGRPFQQRSARDLVAHSVMGLPPHPLDRPTPHGHRRQPVPPVGFGLLPFRSPLLRESSLFLGVLRCFSSPTYLHGVYVFNTGSPGITPVGLPHSDILGSVLARSSPRRFVAWPRPSSAPDAKASTVCSSCGRSSRFRHALRPGSPVPASVNGTPDTLSRSALSLSTQGRRLLGVVCRCLRMVLPCSPLLRCDGGAEGIRTPDLRRAKAALSRLSYSPIVETARWAFVDSNHGPHPYQGCALTN